MFEVQEYLNSHVLGFVWRTCQIRDTLEEARAFKALAEEQFKVKFRIVQVIE